MPKIILSGHILIPIEDVIEVQDALPGHLELTRNEKGCIKFNVTQDKKQLNKYSVYEEFIDQAAFDSHQQRVKNSHWGKVSQNVERHYEISKIID